MKKMTTITAGLLAFCVIGAGCQIHQTFDNLVPEEYGAWENYYIYHGNVKSKTTGEDSAYLVTEVTAGEDSYKVECCTDSEVLQDDIYMCLTLTSTGADFTGQKEALLVYNVATKLQKTLMLDYTCQAEDGLTYIYHPYSIENLDEDGLLLYGQRETIAVDENGVEHTEYISVYFTIDCEGNFKEEGNLGGNGYTRIGDEYFIKKDGDAESGAATIYYLTFGMEEGMPICTFDNNEVYVECEFVETESVEGFLLKTYALEDVTALENYQGERLQKVEFFNPKTNETTLLYSGNTFVEWVDIPSATYFITYEYASVQYTTKSGMFDEPTSQTAVLKKNCTVQQIVYSTDKVETKVKYTFKEGMGLQGVRGVDRQGNMYLSLEWYESAVGCKNGGHQSKNYKLNLGEDKLQQVKQEEWNKAKEICQGSRATVACGPSYRYYIERIALNTVNNKTSYAYRLQRYDESKKTTDVMQLWKGVGSDEQEKYSEMMWKNNGGDMDNFIVRPF